MQSISSKNLCLETWGLVPYQTAFERQAKYVEEIISGQRPETLIFCSHPPVVTLGRGTQPSDVFSWRGELIEVNRGGRATYHGPSQLVFYPLLDLSGQTDKKIKPKDLHGYMRILEEVTIETLKEFGVQARGHSEQTQLDGDKSDATGVWVGQQKMASIGIAVKKWITSHGIAINLSFDSKAFSGINPCGFSTKTMVSLEELLGEPVDREKFQALLLENFLKYLGDASVE